MEGEYKSLKCYEEEERAGFIAKVYSILSLQIITVILFSIPAVASTSYCIYFLLSDVGLSFLWISIALTLILSIIIYCFQSFVRRVPHGYICLAVYTVCEAYIVSFLCAFSDPVNVMMAAIMTVALTTALTVYAWKTKSDFTVKWSAILILCVALFMFALFACVLRSRFLVIMYCCIAIIIYGVFIIFDTQLILGGKTYQLEIDDYILAAMLLFMDIIVLFVRLLQLLGAVRS